jgi:hypothetical protein
MNKHTSLTALASLLALTLSFSSSLASPSIASAQAAHVALHGEVHGTELSLEGGMHAPRGGTLRWLVTAYEVVGLSDLRLAPHAEVQVTTALDPTAAPLVFHVDAHAQATIELPIPANAPGSFGVVIRVVSGQAQRRFELSVTTVDPRELRLWVARDVVARGGLVHAFGRLRDRNTDRPIVGQTVRLVMLDGASRPLGAPIEVTTDASGLFARALTVPEATRGSVSIQATAFERTERVSAGASVNVEDPRDIPLLVSLAPEQWIVEPDATIGVEAVVRTGDGRPVEGARVELPIARGAPRPEVVTTDARGHVHFRWQAPPMGGGFTDTSITITASREHVGAASGSCVVRVANIERAASFGVEGGALVPSIGGRVYVRVVNVDGTAAPAGVSVQISGPRIAQRTATTDASGIAMFDVTLGALAEGSQDRCGGDAATAISIDASGATVLEGCVALDPDGTARIRAASPVVRPGTSVHFDVARAPSVAHLPIAVSVISLEGEPTSIAEGVIAGNASGIDLALPAARTGVLVVRARPLHGATERPLRGGATAVWALPGDLYSLTARIGDHGGEIDAHADTTAFVAALPVDEAHVIAERLRRELLRTFGDLRVDPGSATPLLLTATLAVVTPLDLGAPFVLRSGAPQAVPAPESPESLGLLRDPWRSQARFVEGRLALVFQAIERYVAAAVPERIEDVAVQSGGRWDFNAQILAAVADGGGLGAEGATGLGGEDLTVAGLRAFDGAFTYDSVARRITRERLFRLLVALRSYVRQQGFDLPWARLGDPSTWLQHTTEIYVQPFGAIQARELVDAWGRPFVLRPVSGRPRFGSWSPLDGWEVCSPGPDGVAGNGDDVFDPTARVLPTTSTYGRAVGEDALVARLAGVELGRATVDLLGQFEGQYAQGVPSSPDEAAVARGLSVWQDLPSLFVPDDAPLALRRPTVPTMGAGGTIVALNGEPIPLAFDEEPRTWGLVGFAYSAAGVPAVVEARAVRGSPLIVSARFPTRLHEGEPVVVTMAVTNTSDVDRTLAIAVQGEGALSGDGVASLRVAAGTAELTHVTLRPTGTGHAHAIVAFREAGTALRTMRYELALESGLHPIRARIAGLSAGSYHAQLDVSGRAQRASGRVVIVGPAGLHRDPDLAEVRERDPALLAWSAVLSGAELDETFRADLLRAQGPDGRLDGDEPMLSTACALVAWSAADPDDDAAASGRERAIGAINDVRFADADAEAGVLRGEAALLGALAPSGIADPADSSEALLDPVARLTASHRARLRRALRRYPEEPTLLARAAAALLLASPDDAYGRVMFDRAVAHLHDAGGGRLVTASTNRAGALEEITASLALAVAAHQLGQDALARALITGALSRDHLVTHAGGEPLFWWLANGAYGVLGGGTPASARVSVGGRSTDATFDHGVAIVPIDSPSGSVGVDVTTTGDALALVRAEAIYVEPFTAESNGPIELALEGDVGAADGTAALELVVRAREAVRAPVVMLELPAGFDLDDESLAAQLTRAGGVMSVTPRRPGFVRVTLGALGAGQELRIPLALRWTLGGTLHGLAAVAYDAERPEARTVIAPIEIDRSASQ